MFCQDMFDHCPNCARKTLFRTANVYRCPKCFRFFCDRCHAGNWLTGYKCPHCTFHVSTMELSDIRSGCC